MNSEVVSSKKEDEKKKDSSKVYFFIIAIAALLATNIYFYVKFKTNGEKVYALTVEKENLQVQIDRIEAELDKIDVENVQLTPEMTVQKEDSRTEIAELRKKLENKSITPRDIDDAQRKINQLKKQVDNYRVDVQRLIQENQILSKQNSSLNESVAEKNKQITTLTTTNSELKEKVTTASALKVSSISINGLEVKRNGKESVEERAKRVDKLKINFTIADNPLAKSGERDVFVRIIDPQGNLVVQGDNIFFVHGEKLQYTFKHNILFTNKGEDYIVYWAADNGFTKGAYTILLYEDNAIMGRSTIVLR
jgi:regulator of replication initiation timing